MGPPLNLRSTWRRSNSIVNEQPLISAVICTRNRPDMIERAVHSVLENEDASFELIVIDQSSDDATRQAISAHLEDPRLTYVHTTRVGLSAAYNTGIARSRGAIIAFTDDDCVAPPHWLRSIRSEFAKHPDVDLLYGEVRIPADAWEQGLHIPALNFAHRERLSHRDGFRVLGMGANFALRRKAAGTRDAFDEVLGGGGPLRSSQDFDLQYRLFRRGLVSLATPEVGVDHYGLRNEQQWPATLFAYGVGDGAFYMKHIRCADLLALRLYVTCLGRETVRLVVKRLRRRPHRTEYLKGLLRGGLGSFRFPVDRQHRMYVLR